MDNNDILRQLRYALNISNETMIKIFAESGLVYDQSTVIYLLMVSDDPLQIACIDDVLRAFLDGLILFKRGPNPHQKKTNQEEEPITNNTVLKKIRIALELKEEDMMAIMKLAEFNLSRYELSALFRRSDHKNFRLCGDQFLRNFMRGLALYSR